MNSTKEKVVYKVTAVGSVVNVVLVVLKFFAGFLGKSSAMVADAVHSLSDLLSDAVVFIFVKIAAKPVDRTHEYGHGKYETMATLVVGVIMFVSGLVLLIEGGQDSWRFLKGEADGSPKMIALIVAIASIVLKEAAYQYTVYVGKKINSSILIANAWHHRSDAITSIATLLGIAGAMFLGDRWRILDPLAAMVVSVFILKVGYDIMKPALEELLEKSLPEDTENEIVSILNSVDGVEGVHKLRTRKIGDGIAINVHLEMEGDIPLTEAHAIANEAESALKRKYGENTYVGIHMEPKNVE